MQRTGSGLCGISWCVSLKNCVDYLQGIEWLELSFIAADEVPCCLEQCYWQVSLCFAVSGHVVEREKQ